MNEYQLASYYQEHPLEYMHDALDVKYIIPELCDAVNLMLENRRVYVRSGHGIGKSYIAACLGLWFFDCFPNAQVYTTAPTQRQVRDIVWKEIHSISANANIEIKATKNNLDFHRGMKWVLKGFASSGSVAYQGRHAKHMLWIIDEADGFDSETFDAIESTATGPKNYLFYIGNPVDPDSAFKLRQERRPDLTCTISSYKSPNIIRDPKTNEYISDEIIPGCATLEWVEEMKSEWGEESSVFLSRVSAEYPSATPDALLTEDECKQASLVKPKPANWAILGVDVAYMGDDNSVITALSGNAFYKHPLVFNGLKGWELKDEILKFIDLLKVSEGIETKAIVYDSAGVATALQEHLDEHFAKTSMVLYPVNFGSEVTKWRVEAEDKQMHMVQNKRAEMYLDFRRSVRHNELFVPASYNIKQVIPRVKYFINSGQKLQIEAKQEFKKREGYSPDIPDSIILALHGYIQGLHMGGESFVAMS